jgi:hypothetical protein
MEVLNACVAALQTCNSAELKTAVILLNATNPKNASTFATNLGQGMLHVAIGYFIKLDTEAKEVVAELQAILRFLVAEAGCGVGAGDDKGMAPVHYAAQCVGATGVTVLQTLEKDCKADMDVLDKLKESVMHKACQAGNMPVVEYLYSLMQSGRPMVHLQVDRHNEKHMTPLAMAIENGHMPVVRFLVQTCGVSTGAISKAERNTALHHAAFYKQLEMCTFFVEECKSDVTLKDSVGLTALHFAAMSGSAPVALYLAEQKADVMTTDTLNRNLLHLAAGAGHMSVLRLILGDVVSSSEGGEEEGKQTPAASTSTSTSTSVGNLFSAIDINSKDGKKTTGLHIALDCLEHGAAVYLLRKGAMASPEMVRKLKKNAPASALLAKCYVCMQQPGKFLCTRCKHRRYCSVECQKIDYKGKGGITPAKHSSICKLFAS